MDPRAGLEMKMYTAEISKLFIARLEVFKAMLWDITDLRQKHHLDPEAGGSRLP